jgi:hypothetical protein
MKQEKVQYILFGSETWIAKKSGSNNKASRQLRLEQKLNAKASININM